LSLSGTDSGATPGHDRATGRFVSGYTEARRDKQKRITKRTLELIESYAVSTPADMALCALAAAHLDDAQHARSRISRVRSTNAAYRLLRDLKRKPEPPPPTLEEMRAADDEAANG
jgi:hypothetical protein